MKQINSRHAITQPIRIQQCSSRTSLFIIQSTQDQLIKQVIVWVNKNNTETSHIPYRDHCRRITQTEHRRS